MFHAFKHCSRIRVNWSKSNAPTFLWIPWEFATLWQGQRPWNQWASWAPRKKNPTPCSLLDLGSQQLHQFHPRKASNLKKKNVGFSSSGHSKSAFFKKPFWDLRQFRAGFSHICQLSGAPGNKWWIFTLPTEQKANPGRPFKKKTERLRWTQQWRFFRSDHELPFQTHQVQGMKGNYPI